MNRSEDDSPTAADEPEDSRATERLIAFSDAVVAIAITLLALELPVPSGHTFSQYWSSVRADDGHYLAFLISFVAIAAAWIQHHRIFNYIERMDPWLRNLNLGWLLMIVLNPFATKLLTTEGQDSLTVHALTYGFYALLQTVAAVTMLAMVHRMRTLSLLTSDAPPSLVTDTDRHSLGVILGFGLSIPVFFVTTYGWILWFASPILLRQVRRLLGRRDPEPS
jgi:uncharacterized membrane protein